MKSYESPKAAICSELLSSSLMRRLNCSGACCVVISGKSQPEHLTCWFRVGWFGSGARLLSHMLPKVKSSQRFLPCVNVWIGFRNAELNPRGWLFVYTGGGVLSVSEWAKQLSNVWMDFHQTWCEYHLGVYLKMIDIWSWSVKVWLCGTTLLQSLYWILPACQRR